MTYWFFSDTLVDRRQKFKFPPAKGQGDWKVCMQHNKQPDIGIWYKNQDISNIFEVVATDEDEGSIEIQYFTGEIDEIDIETWFEMDLRIIPAPEDWSGPYEIAREDLDYFDETFHPEDWSGPLTELEPEDYY